MDFEKAWREALKHTEIVRTRVQALMTSQETHVPYIMLSESEVSQSDTVVRKGSIVVEKPSIIVPPNNPQFNGFEFDEGERIDENSLINFLLVRGVTIPSMKYDNKTSSLDIFEGKLSKAVQHYEKLLQQKENVSTGLIIGPADYWQFSILIFICSQIARNVDTDIRKLLEQFKEKDD